MCFFTANSLLQNFLSFYGEKYCHLIIGKLDVKGQVNKPVDTYTIREQCFNNYLKLIGVQRKHQGSNSTLDLLENQFPAITWQTSIKNHFLLHPMPTLFFLSILQWWHNVVIYKVQRLFHCFSSKMAVLYSFLLSVAIDKEIIEKLLQSPPQNNFLFRAKKIFFGVYAQTQTFQKAQGRTCNQNIFL